MKKTLLISALALGFGACAALPLAQALMGQRVSVTVPSELPLPDTLTLELSGGANEAAKLGDVLMGALGQGSLEDRLGAALKQQAAPLRKAGAKAFHDELAKAKLFGSLVEEGGNVGLALGVGRWGIAYDADSSSYQPVLDLEATLSEPHLGVVWRGQRSAAQLSAGAKKLVGKVDLVKLAARPGGINDLMGIVTRDLSRQLVEDLRQHPPLSQFGN